MKTQIESELLAWAVEGSYRADLVAIELDLINLLLHNVQRPVR